MISLGGHMNTIYVGNIPYNLEQSCLENLFAQYGAIKDVSVIKDHKTGQLKGFGFITFGDSDTAKMALAQDGKEFQGRLLKVNMATPRNKKGLPACAKTVCTDPAQLQ